MSALRGSLFPIILVVVMCVMAAIPLGPSLSQVPPQLEGEPGTVQYEKNSNIRKMLGLQKRVFTSVVLGALVSAWIFSGTWAFALVCGVAGSRALLEYYGMAERASNECKPAKKCGTVVLWSMYMTACGTAYGLPFAYTDCVLPVAYILIVGYLLTLKRSEKTTISSVQTTFMGIFYVGYLASFWVRLRALGVIPSEEVSRVMAVPMMHESMQWLSFLGLGSADIFTQGAVVTWWTMISIAASGELPRAATAGGQVVGL